MSRRSLKSRGKEMFENKQLADIEFCFEECGGSGEKKIISANRAILAISSPVFEAMFFGGLAESNSKPIKIEDIDYDSFRSFLSFIYTRELVLESVEDAIKIFYAARKYDVADVEDICESFLYTKIEPNNVCQIFEFGKFFEKSELREICMAVIRQKTSDVFNSNGFLEAELSTIYTIFEQDELFISSELELFDALNRYAIKNNLIKVRTEEDEKTNAPTVYGAVKKIRFLTISSEDFAGDPMKSEILSLHEKLAILSNLVALNKAYYSMPEGFTLDTSVRGDRMIICKLKKLQPNHRFCCPHDGTDCKSSMDYILFSCTQFSNGRQKMINVFKDDGVSENLNHVLEKNKPASLRALCKYIRQNELDTLYLSDY